MYTLYAKLRRKKKLSSSQIIILGFMGAILMGTLLLMLPWATREQGSAPFLDALFTATSATCVTGLVTHDTATYWTLFGKAVILCLIQIGGLGVITVAVVITKLSGRKIGLMQRSTMQESIAAPQVGGIVRMTRFIFHTVLWIEALGTIALMPSMIREFGVVKGMGYALFHCISAFCNAGFDLMGVRQPYSSLTAFSNDIGVNIVLMILIIVGGIGFLTWEDIARHRFHFTKYRMQSKVILVVTGVLLVLPTIYFYFAEFGSDVWGGMSVKERILCSLFQTVTARTAGFNTVDLTKLSEPGLMIMILLMMIGGSTGSTAGGMKTTTVAVLFATAVSVFKRRPNAHMFGRRVPNDTAHYAATVVVLYVSLMLGGGIFIAYVEKIPILPALFEAASAIATVGLSLSGTPSFGAASKLVLILLMFLGRVGGMTIVYAALSRKHPYVSELPQEKIMVG
jgi:trk system potassium uptake protein TrkH